MARDLLKQRDIVAIDIVFPAEADSPLGEPYLTRRVEVTSILVGLGAR